MPTRPFTRPSAGDETRLSWGNDMQASLSHCSTQLLLLFALLLSPALAQDWQLIEPAMPVQGQSSEAVLFRVRGPAGLAPYLKIASQSATYPLTETSKGDYQTTLWIPNKGRHSVFLIEKESDFPRNKNEGKTKKSGQISMNVFREKLIKNKIPEKTAEKVMAITKQYFC